MTSFSGGRVWSKRAPETRYFLEAPLAAPGTLRLLSTLALAVLAVSLAAPLIRLAAAPFLAVAFWRMAASTLLTGTLWAACAPRERPRGRRQWAMLGLAGLFLALHFAAWIASLALTSVAVSVVLVNTMPLFAALFAALFLHEPTTPRQLLGILLAMLGALLIAAEESLAGTGLAGSLLALAGAAAAAAYYVIGRALRPSLGLWAYVTPVYAASALALLAAALLAGVPLLAYSPTQYALFLALALGPSLLGHTLLNYTLRWLPAPVVNVATLGEPLLAALLAALLPAIGELPTSGVLLGGLVTLAGICLVVQGRKAEKPPLRASPKPREPVERIV